MSIPVISFTSPNRHAARTSGEFALMSRQAAAIDPDQSPPSVVHHKMATLEARFFSGASTTTVWPRTYRSLQHSARLNCATGDLATEVAGGRGHTLGEGGEGGQDAPRTHTSL